MLELRPKSMPQQIFLVNIFIFKKDVLGLSEVFYSLVLRFVVFLNYFIALIDVVDMLAFSRSSIYNFFVKTKQIFFDLQIRNFLSIVNYIIYQQWHTLTLFAKVSNC